VSDQPTSICSQGSEDLLWPSEPPDSEPLALLKPENTLQQSCDGTGPTSKTTETSETCRRDTLMSLRRGFHARLQASQGRGVEVQTRDGCGSRPLNSVAQYAPDSRSLRTFQVCFQFNPEEHSTASLADFTKEGLMLGGSIFPLVPLVRITSESELSLLPTITVKGNALKKLGFMELLPTARESMGTHGICWKRAKSGEHKSNLEDYLGMLWLRDGYPQTSGLNVSPDWCDWFMGYPIGHTDLRLSGTAFSRSKSTRLRKKSES
jgi:hypothetical protein